MNELQLIETAEFDKVQCDFYGDGKDLYVTREQIGMALEYANPQKAIGNLHAAHKERMEKYSFLDSRNGRNIYFYNRKGIMELCRWSQQPKADAFMDWTWEVMDSLISGHGKLVALPRDYPSALRALADEAEKNIALVAENTMQKQIIAEYEPKAQYVDKILSSKGTLTVKQIAADYDMTAQQLNRILHEEHVQYKVNDQWILYKEHMGMGYTKSNQVPIIHSDGRDGFKLHTQWTQKGRLFIHEILTKRGIMAVIDRKLASEQIAM